MPHNNDIIENCIKRWQADDSVCNRMIESYPVWISQMSEKMREIIEIQMGFFDYYSHESVNGYLKALHGKLHEIEGVCFNNTIYTVLPNQNGRLNSGSYYLIEYKEINKISKYVVFPSFADLIDKLQYIDNIVIVDDFCGSGKTLIDFLSKYLDYLKNKNVYYLVVHVMSGALIEIGKFSMQNSLKTRVIYCKCSDKAFLNKQLENRKDEFINESRKMGLQRDCILGFKDTESLVAFYNNTPNNTLGIYWREEKNYTPLIPRNNDEKPSWQQLKTDKKKRLKNNYMNNVRNRNG